MLYDNEPRGKRLSSGSTRGLMDGAAEPGQTLPKPKDKQQQKIQEVLAEVDVATNAMTHTFMKLQERGQKLDDLREQSDKLSISSQTFRTSATKTRRRMWLQNAKWTICVTIFMLLILAGVIAGAVKGSQVAKEKIVEKVSSVTAMPASSASSSPTSGVASVVSTGKESGNLGNSVTASPVARSV